MTALQILPPADVAVRVRADHDAAILAVGELTNRCDRDGYDWSILREADSRGPVYQVTILAADTQQRVVGYSERLVDAITVALAELARRDLR